MNYGFITPAPDKDEYLLGTLAGDVIRPNGQWDEFLPVYEPQAEKFETSGCTVWGTQNAIEILYKALFNEEPNYAERFNYILAGVTLAGADPHMVCQEIRNDGLIPQTMLPMTDTYQEFIQPYPMTTLCLTAARLWKSRHTFKHEWVLSSKDEQWKTKMKYALTLSPLAAAVAAWTKNGEYYNRVFNDNHWVVIYGYEEGRYWKCFDSYDHSEKKLLWDFGFTYVKRFYLAKNSEPTPNTTEWFIVRVLKNLLNYFKVYVGKSLSAIRSIGRK